MDSEDSSSSSSDSESNNKGPRSPSPTSIQSADGDSQDYKRPKSSRGPRSPSPCGPRSPSPEDSNESNSDQSSSKSTPKGSPIHSIKRDTRFISNDRYDNIKSPSANSISSQDDDDENSETSMKSDVENENIGPQTPKSSSSRSSSKSKTSIKSKGSIKSLSPIRRTPHFPKSPENSLDRRGPMSPPLEDGDTTDSSVSSRASRTSKSSRNSRQSLESRGSRRSIRSVASPSSRTSKGSRNSSRNKSNDRLDAQAEEISDGDMEYEAGKNSNDIHEKLKTSENVNLNLSHEDLSDVSDLESLGDADNHSENESVQSDKQDIPTLDLRQKLEEAKNKKTIEKQMQNPPEKTSKTEDGEEQLDFEAEDGECIEETTKSKPMEVSGKEPGEEDENKEVVDQLEKEKEEVEEGEVTDDDEVRPEETEPRPVCRFYSRGQCTWGASCRFLHPGVTDKGNYTMFDLIRPVVPGAPGYGIPEERFERPGYGVPPLRTEPPVIESAWERGLRTAKEMMRKAIKRKEQDMDFEEKKMNLTLAQDEMDKENGYYTRSASPVPVEAVPRHYSGRHPLEYPRQGGGEGVDARRRQLTVDKIRHHTSVAAKPRVPQEDYYGRRVVYEPEPRAVRIEPEYEARERIRSYRELPPHRMPDFYNDKYEEPVVQPRRPKREVIVQRIEPTGGRGDEWADPWMRSKSPSARGKPGRLGPRRQSYSSASSYSSSSSSRSSSGSSKSSYHGSRSRSQSPRRRRGGKSPHRVHRVAHRTVSPSVIVSERKAANERALLMNPPAPSPKKAHKDVRPPSPGMMRTSAQNPPAPTKGLIDQYGRTRDRKHDTERKKFAVAAALVVSAKSRAQASRSSSGSDSSGSSSSDSESSYSSSSSSRDGSPAPRRKVAEKVDLALALKAKALDVLKTGADKKQLKLSLKAQTLKKNVELSDLNRKSDKIEVTQGKKRPANSPPAVDSISAPKLAAVSGSKNSINNKKSTSRREELLKQLKAVEDAIAKKRSKIN